MDADRRAIDRAVEAALGGGKIICDRCHATLDTFADTCTADLADECPGFTAINQVKSRASRNGR